MTKYMVSYTLQGRIEVEASSEEDASDRVEGIITNEDDVIPDKTLIEGIEGYVSTAGDEEFNITSDAIVVTEVEEVITAPLEEVK